MFILGFVLGAAVGVGAVCFAAYRQLADFALTVPAEGWPELGEEDGLCRHESEESGRAKGKELR